MDTYTTDKNGSFTTKEYVCGDNWTIREIEPSEGYLLDTTHHKVGAEPVKYTVEHNPISMGVTEQVIKGDVSIIKHTDNGETKIETPEAGAEFQVYLKLAGSFENANTEAKKQELFAKTRKGDVRVLLGSTQKMGAGTNVQDKLVALHDLDCPWRPSDLEQRSGRIIRQGNENKEVEIFRYVTEETFDAYLYQLVEGKQKFSSQIMTSKSPVRSAEDIDETALSYAEIKMLATENPYIKEKMDLDIQVQKLQLLKSNYLSEKYALEDKVIKFYPQEINRLTGRIDCLKSDMELAKNNPKSTADEFVGMKIGDKFVSDKEQAGLLLLEACKTKTQSDATPLGEYAKSYYSLFS